MMMRHMERREPEGLIKKSEWLLILTLEIRRERESIVCHLTNSICFTIRVAILSKLIIFCQFMTVLPLIQKQVHNNFGDSIQM
jgi:hypothetical protein